MQDILLETKDGIATLTLNRPSAMNALSSRLRAELQTAFEDLGADDAVEVIIVTGAGERAFSAGLDLKELSGQAVEGSEGASDAVAGGGNLVEAMEISSLSRSTS